MDIQVGDIYSVVLNPRQHLESLEVIRQICRARPDGFQFMPKYRSGMWDGWISLMKSLNSFPTGLLPQVVEALRADGVDVHLSPQDVPAHKIVTPDTLNGVTLRSYQVAAANILLDTLHGVAKMATNSGKTEVIAAIIKSFYDPRAVVLVHRKELLYQTAKRLSSRLGMDVGIIGDGHWNDNNVIVAMVQTLYAALGKQSKKSKKSFEFFPGNEVLIVDECHHVSSDSMLDVMSYIPGPYRFGLSGTPLRYDNLADMKLIAYTGEIAFEITNDFMIRHGWSARPIVKLYVIERDETWNMSYVDAYVELIVRNDVRNVKIADIVRSFEGLVLILVNQIEHGERLQLLLPGAVFVHGSHDAQYRQDILETMRQSKRGIFIASPIFDEGIDVPSVDMVVLAGGGRGYSKLLQRIGRGLRRKNGHNNELIVIDFIDDTNDYLLNHTEERISTYEAEGFQTTICD